MPHSHLSASLLNQLQILVFLQGYKNPSFTEGILGVHPTGFEPATPCSQFWWIFVLFSYSIDGENRNDYI